MPPTPHPDVASAARAYLKRGWAIVPLRAGEKGTDAPGWVDLVFKASDLEPGGNLGVKTGEKSGGLVDVDLDSLDAVRVAPRLLPATGLVHGRPGKPLSHWWYRCSAQKRTVKWKDVDDSSIVEIRADAAQTAVPPSVHPSGEVLAWEREDEPLEIEPADLARAVTLVAVAALVAKHYPGSGGRHEGALALGGFLARVGVSAEDCGRVALAAAEAAGDREHRDRARAAQESAVKVAEELAGGEPAGPVTGGGKLANLLGDEVVKRLRSWFGAEQSKQAERLIEKLNERHAVVFQRSGEMVVITEDHDPVLERKFLRYSSFEDVKKKYPEKVVVGASTKGPIVMKLGAWWLEHPRRRKYEGIVFAPGADAPEDYYNLWRGFAVEPRRGSWARFRQHVEEVVCRGNAEVVRYVFAWMADAVRRPGEPGEVAIAIRGGQGSGKGFFAREFGRLFGQHFVHLDSGRHLTGNFNAHLQDAVLVFADEAAWPGDKAGLGTFKRIITEPTLAVERKGVDVVTVKNVMHVLLASNEHWVVPAGLDDRRFLVLDAAQAKVGDHKWFEAIRREMRDEGGAEALLHDLLQWDLSGVNLRRPPQTAALLEQKILSMEPAVRWWFSKLSEGRLLQSDQKWPREVDSERLYEDYVERLAQMGVQRRASKAELGRLLKHVLPEGSWRSRRLTTEGTEARHWVVPALDECRLALAHALRTKAEDLFPRHHLLDP